MSEEEMNVYCKRNINKEVKLFENSSHAVVASRLVRAVNVMPPKIIIV